MRTGSLGARIAPVLIRAIVSVATTTIASADDAPEPRSVTADDLAVRESPSLFHDPGEPLLTLDVVPRPNMVGLGVTEDTHRTAIQLGPRAKVMMTGTSWRGYADAVPIDGVPENDVARGTRMAIGFHYDFGWLQLDASMSQNVLSSRYGSGAYRDVSLTISKSHRFSRWVTGWIGLSIGQRTWTTDPPDGEEKSTTIMLTIGGTFR